MASLYERIRMDVNTRRNLIKVSANPNPKLDYVSGFEGKISPVALDHPAELIIRYVPDRLILLADGFDTYLGSLEQALWPSLEELAVVLLDDIRNEVVARWVQVNLKYQPTRHPHLNRQVITLEDYQPDWDNDILLSHLPLV